MNAPLCTDEQVALGVIDLLNEAAFFEKLNNQQLVTFCLSTDAADYPVVIEMMNRLYPGWENSK